MDASLLSLTTLWQNIGGVMKTPGIVNKVNAWASLFTNYMILLKEYINQFNIKFYIECVLIFISTPFLISSLKSGIPARYLPIRIIMFGSIIGFSFLNENQSLVIRIVILAVPLIVLLLIRHLLFKCWRSTFDDMKVEEDIVSEQQKIISGDFNANDYLQEIKDKFQLSQPKLWAAIIKLIVGLICIGLVGFFIKLSKSGDTGGGAIGALIFIQLSLYFVPSGIFGLTERLRKLKSKIKVVLKKYFFKVLIVFFNICYVPLLTLFIKSLIATTIQCEEGYYWGSGFRFVETPFRKDLTKCYPCGYTLEDLYPGFENSIQTLQNGDNGPYFKWIDKYGLLSHDIYLTQTAIGINVANTHKYIINKTCEKQCSGEKTYVLAEEKSLYFVQDVIINGFYFIIWMIAFILIGLPTIYVIITYRSAKTLKSLVAYGKDVEEKWKNLMQRVDTVGVSFCQKYTSSNMYWEVFKIIYKFLIMFFVTLSEHFNKYAIWVVPVIQGAFLVVTAIRMPFFSKWNNYLDIFLCALDIFVSNIASFNTIFDIDESINSALANGAVVVGAIATVVVIILNMFFKNDDNDPSRLPIDDEKKFKKEEEIIETSTNTENVNSSKRKIAVENSDNEELDNLGDDIAVNFNPSSFNKDELNPIDQSITVIKESSITNSFEFRKRMTVLYMAYDLKLDDVEFSILSRYLRLFSFYGLIAAFDLMMQGAKVRQQNICWSYFG